MDLMAMGLWVLMSGLLWGSAALAILAAASRAALQPSQDRPAASFDLAILAAASRAALPLLDVAPWGSAALAILAATVGGSGRGRGRGGRGGLVRAGGRRV